MQRSLKCRLSVMMFLQYFVPGATVPILSHYLKNHLGFEPYQVGHVLAMPAVAATFAPFIATHIADRFMGSERLLALCHFLAGCVMLALSQQTGYRQFVVLYFAYGLLFAPTFGLTNTVALHHVKDAKRDFGGIRMWGTASWVVMAFLFGFLWLRGGTGSERLQHALYVSAFTSFGFSMYALTLPRFDVGMEKTQSVMYWKALKLFLRPSLALLCVLTFLTSVVHQSYYFGMSPFLSQSGLANEYIMPLMSLGQLSEVFVLSMLGWCLARLPVKRVLLIGVMTQILRHSLFAYGHPLALVAGAIGLHGICYAFFFTTAYLYVNQHSTPDTRAGAQQILTMMIAGVGTLGGALCAGYVGQLCKDPVTGLVDFRHFWMFPAGLACAVSLTLALFFREERAG